MKSIEETEGSRIFFKGNNVGLTTYLKQSILIKILIFLTETLPGHTSPKMGA